ncbi:ABC transporter substrate-binding protein [Mycoplasma leonicaptivi]|uniref:ABC transporter substrate-binding protein n=1 Tax=Mycoplasma leonicaptivi TaxID=36742 RepID=UPI000486F807|nr:ABC transporter substrate-binding protein [Mycoplasma leonicaptivi]
MKKIKKYLIGSSFLLPVTTLAAACQSKAQEQERSQTTSKIDYDLGLATEPINNLNYIRYKSMDKILPSLVDPFIKDGPSGGLKSLIKTNEYNMVIVDTANVVDDKNEPSSNFNDLFKNKSLLSEKDGYGRVTGSYYQLTNFELVGGLAANTSSNDVTKTASIYAFRNPKNSSNYIAFTGRVNKKLNTWSNGDYISATDLRDYLEYILDLSTGSQRLEQIQKFGIRGTDRFIAAQKEYAQKFNKSYLNPWGKRKYIEVEGKWVQDPKQLVWQSQFEDKRDLKEVEAIKNAALDFGFYTGQLYLDYTNEEVLDLVKKSVEKNIDFSKEVVSLTIKDEKTQTNKVVELVKNPFVNPYQEYELKLSGDNSSIKTKYNQIANSENAFTMIFDQNKTPSLVFLVSHILTNLYPVNRKYIETEIGGIDKFGSQPDKFLTSGPFTIDPSEINLGPQGQIILRKNNDYFDANNTISNKIKIIFSTDKNTNATFFEDQYISQTFIPANKINQYWSSPEYKEYLKKNSGYGTIAFGFNLDNQTNWDSYLQDQDLRNAIYYAINREDAIKFVGWDFSFPVNTFTSYGQYKTFDGKNIETYFSDLSSQTKNNKEYPLQNYDYVVHLAKSFTFEKTVRGDLLFDSETANFYLNRFKTKHPNLSKVTLRFINNSTDEQKKAGIFLKEQLRKVFGEYIEIDIKSLPENTFATFIEQGKYDIIYQNYDRLGGNGAEDYIATFFKVDEIDELLQKNIAFKINPVGSYTYADYVTNLVLEKNSYNGDINFLKQLLNSYIQVIYDKAQELYGSQFSDLINSENIYNITQFTNSVISDLYNKLHETNLVDKQIYSHDFIKYALEYLLVSDTKQNVKVSRLKKLTNLFVLTKYGVEQIANLTKDTKQRLKIQTTIPQEKNKNTDFWVKFIELSYQKPEESLSDYSDRISAFFSSNFSSEEVRQGWTQELVYIFIGEMEKIIRDGAFIVPLMEVDTNWEITRVGGVSSLYKFALQYAYDYLRPPKPGLPRRKEG